MENFNHCAGKYLIRIKTADTNFDLLFKIQL